MNENELKMHMHLIKAKELIDESINPLENRFNLNKENDPKNEDTLSQLISKLSYTVNQMWSNQDILYKIRFMTQDEFMATDARHL